MYKDHYFYKALEDIYNGEVQKAKAELKPFFDNPTGVADHSDFIKVFKEKLEKIDDYEGQLEKLKKHFG